MELRLVAEAGLVGLPNAGKSTLLAALSAARPKIAAYPFTTLSPNLGRVYTTAEEAFSVADIPGLIEGAHLGNGLGIRFLKHLRRTRVLVYVLDLTGDPPTDFATVRSEIEAFDAEMVTRPALIALNKLDLVVAANAADCARTLYARTGLEIFVISAAESVGLAPLVAAIAAKLKDADAAAVPAECPR
jgi:GTP-binding protein